MRKVHDLQEVIDAMNNTENRFALKIVQSTQKRFYKFDIPQSDIVKEIQKCHKHFPKQIVIVWTNSLAFPNICHELVNDTSLTFYFKWERMVKRTQYLYQYTFKREQQ